jgi:hypothetical protein
MPRPRKPRHVLEDTGAFAHDPQRRRAREHEATSNGPVGEPPDYFNQTHQDVWREFTSEAPWLACADRKMLEVAVRLTVRIRRHATASASWIAKAGNALERVGMDDKDVAGFEKAMLEAMTPSPREYQMLGSCIARLGMSASSRVY